jgi:hypothetical protein
VHKVLGWLTLKDLLMSGAKVVIWDIDEAEAIKNAIR